MIKLVLSDIDNTLTPFGLPHASERTLTAIHACLDAGVAFAPASGRNREEVAGFLCHDEEAYRTAVLVNGQEVYLEGRLVQRVTLDAEALHDAAAYLRDRPRCAVLAFRADGFCDWVGDARERLMPLFGNAVRNGGERHATLPAHPVAKGGIIAQIPREEELALQAELIERYPSLDFMNTVSQWFDIVPHGWSKAKGIEVLERELGIAPDEICVFGDAENDLPMFAQVTHSCAVANAIPEVQAAARWHVGAAADDGVAVALEQIAAAARDAQETGAEVLPAFMR